MTFPVTLWNSTTDSWSVHVAALATKAAHEALLLASLAYKTAGYLLRRGLHAEAEVLFERALHIRKQAPGPEHPYVAESLNNLAVLFGEQGQYAEAERILRRALHIRSRRSGPSILCS